MSAQELPPNYAPCDYLSWYSTTVLTLMYTVAKQRQQRQAATAAAAGATSSATNSDGEYGAGGGITMSTQQHHHRRHSASNRKQQPVVLTAEALNSSSHHNSNTGSLYGGNTSTNSNEARPSQQHGECENLIDYIEKGEGGEAEEAEAVAAALEHDVNTLTSIPGSRTAAAAAVDSGAAATTTTTAEAKRGGAKRYNWPRVVLSISNWTQKKNSENGEPQYQQLLLLSRASQQYVLDVFDRVYFPFDLFSESSADANPNTSSHHHNNRRTSDNDSFESNTSNSNVCTEDDLRSAFHFFIRLCCYFMSHVFASDALLLGQQDEMSAGAAAAAAAAGAGAAVAPTPTKLSSSSNTNQSSCDSNRCRLVSGESSVIASYQQQQQMMMPRIYAAGHPHSPPQQLQPAQAQALSATTNHNLNTSNTAHAQQYTEEHSNEVSMNTAAAMHDHPLHFAKRSTTANQNINNNIPPEMGASVGSAGTPVLAPVSGYGFPSTPPVAMGVNSSTNHPQPTASSAALPELPTFALPEDPQLARYVQQSILQVILSIAFSCPCAPLAAAAQLCLAHGIATLGRPLAQATRSRHIRCMLDFLEYLPQLRPGEGATPAAMAPAPPPPQTASLRAKDLLLSFAADGTPSLTRVAAWEQQVLQQQQQEGGGAEEPYLTYGPLPATAALTTTERVSLVSSEYAAGDTRRLDTILRLAESEAATCYWAQQLTSPLLGTLGGGSAPHYVTPQHYSSEHLHGGHALNCATASAPGGGGSGARLTRRGHGHRTTMPLLHLNLPGSGGGGGAAVGSAAFVDLSRLSKLQQRQHRLLCALSRCQLIPRPLTLLTAEDLLYTTYLELGECPQYYRALRLYPDLMRAHHLLSRFLLFGEGPLAVEERLMLAVMAASRHRCEYLVCRFAAVLQRYVQQTQAAAGGAGGGAAEGSCHDDDDDDDVNAVDSLNLYDDTATSAPRYGSPHNGGHGQQHLSRQRSQGGGGGAGSHAAAAGSSGCRWLSEGPPPRLCAVQPFIAKAAHTPWVLEESDVREVLQQGWSIPEVFQLAALLAHVVSLTSFVTGLFVPTEPWTAAVLPASMRAQLRHVAASGGSFASAARQRPPGHVSSSPVPLDTLMAPCLPPALPGESQAQAQAEAEEAAGDMYLCYAGADDVVSEQRIRTSTASRTLWRCQFSWSELGASCMEQYYPTAAGLLSEELESFAELVRQVRDGDCIGLRSRPDLSPSYTLRSLKLYVLNLLGYMVEDYPYNDINKVLRRPAKSLAQQLTQRPETLTKGELRCWYQGGSTTAGGGMNNNNNNNNSSSGPRGGAGSPYYTVQGQGNVKLPVATSSSLFGHGHPSSISSTQSNNSAAVETFAAHQLRREIELLADIKLSTSGASEITEANSLNNNNNNNHAAATSSVDKVQEAVQAALALQDERALLLIALTAMEARKEGMLTLLLYPLYTVLNNM